MLAIVAMSPYGFWETPNNTAALQDILNWYPVLIDLRTIPALRINAERD